MNFTEIEFSKRDENRRLNIPSKITEELAEETGIHCGGGSMNIIKVMYTL